MQQFSIEYLADLCHWSPTHFRRVFHDIMGTSPLDYVNNTRILKSCILLRSTEHSILDISEMVGFHSVSSFNRYFIKLMQMSPREYRKQMQQSEKRLRTSPFWNLPDGCGRNSPSVFRPLRSSGQPLVLPFAGIIPDHRNHTATTPGQRSGDPDSRDAQGSGQ